MTGHEVVIAGGGPAGLMLAAELGLAGIDVLVVERRATQDLDGRRAGGLHARTLEVLYQRGVIDRFLSAGRTHPLVGYAGTSLDISDFPTRHNYLLALWQKDSEVSLAGWVDELVERVPGVLGELLDDLEVEEQVAAGGVPGHPQHPDAVQDVAGRDDRVRHHPRSHLQEHVVDRGAVGAVLDDLDGLDVAARLTDRGCDPAERSGNVREFDT